MAAIPGAFLDLLTTKKAFAHLATLMKDGTPQVSPVCRAVPRQRCSGR